uniref:Uncharacterized protein n=1 Tax=Anguilla anguilla TaxID=7936 RepID=A0A0E9TFB1_ANGAN
MRDLVLRLVGYIVGRRPVDLIHLKCASANKNETVRHVASKSRLMYP